MDKTKLKLMEKLEKKGFDTEKKVCAIDMQIAVDSGLAAESEGILALQKAIKAHSLYSFMTGGTDPKPEKKGAKNNADDNRSSEESGNYSY